MEPLFGQDFGFRPTPSTPVPTSSRGHVYGLHGQYEADPDFVGNAILVPTGLSFVK